jgi:hypothetical protein
MHKDKAKEKREVNTFVKVENEHAENQEVVERDHTGTPGSIWK